MTADLIVVDKLARLYDCPENKMLCHVFALIGRGASVVTLTRAFHRRGSSSNNSRS